MVANTFCAAVDALYGANAAQRQEADRWLSDFKRSPQSWDALATLLQQQASAEVTFVMADVLVHRTRLDWRKMPQVQRDQVLASLGCAREASVHTRGCLLRCMARLNTTTGLYRAWRIYIALQACATCAHGSNFALRELGGFTCRARLGAATAACAAEFVLARLCMAQAAMACRSNAPGPSELICSCVNALQSGAHDARVLALHRFLRDQEHALIMAPAALLGFWCTGHTLSDVCRVVQPTCYRELTTI